MIVMHKFNPLPFTTDSTPDFFALETLFKGMPHFLLKGEEFRAYINKLRQCGTVYITEENNKISSFIGFYANDEITRIAYLSCLVVSPRMKGSGIAQVLFDLMCSEAVKRGMKKLCATVLKDNLRAIAFYKKNNMVPYDSTPDNMRWMIEKDLV